MNPIFHWRIKGLPPLFTNLQKGSVMPIYQDFPTCDLCRSIDLEIVHNDDLGPMTSCSECGFTWIAKYEELTTEVIITQAS